jgi:hypothetical protein
MLSAFQVKVVHLSTQANAQTAQTAAAALSFTGLGYPETWRPGNWMEAAEKILTDEAHSLGEADRYILSPQMCDVVIAAAKTLTLDDLSLILASGTCRCWCTGMARECRSQVLLYDGCS